MVQFRNEYVSAGIRFRNEYVSAGIRFGNEYVSQAVGGGPGYMFVAQARVMWIWDAGDLISVIFQLVYGLIKIR